jgi:hypothetical protein
MIERHADWINPNFDLEGLDSNGFMIVGHVGKALRRAGNSPEVIKTFRAEATSGDYDHLIQTSMVYAGMME